MTDPIKLIRTIQEDAATKERERVLEQVKKLLRFKRWKSYDPATARARIELIDDLLAYVDQLEANETGYEPGCACCAEKALTPTEVSPSVET